MWNRCFQFLNRYKHGLVIGTFSVFYLLAFRLLESRDIHTFHVVHTVFDDMIPFCEFFIVPYLLWFLYMLITVLYFIMHDESKQEYYRLAYHLMLGMSIFLIVSYIYPNIQHLRPLSFPRENIFTDMVRRLYATDTPTNILPSIHVYNSVCIHIAIANCERLKKRPGIRNASLALTVLIILSTMFLKQHSFIDVCLGLTLALFGYVVFYPATNTVPGKNTARVGNRN